MTSNESGPGGNLAPRRVLRSRRPGFVKKRCVGLARRHLCHGHRWQRAAQIPPWCFIVATRAPQRHPARFEVQERVMAVQPADEPSHPPEPVRERIRQHLRSPFLCVCKVGRRSTIPRCRTRLLPHSSKRVPTGGLFLQVVGRLRVASTDEPRWRERSWWRVSWKRRRHRPVRNPRIQPAPRTPPLDESERSSRSAYWEPGVTSGRTAPRGGLSPRRRHWQGVRRVVA